MTTTTTCRHCAQEIGVHQRTSLGDFCPGVDLSEVDFSDFSDFDPDLWERDRYKPAYPQWVSAYEITQGYGGPEEGGWWRDYYTPLESVRVDDEHERDSMLVRLRVRYDLDDGGRYVHRNNPEHPDFDRRRARGRSSAAGGYDIGVWAEYSFAQAAQSPEGGYE